MERLIDSPTIAQVLATAAMFVVALFSYRLNRQAEADRQRRKADRLKAGLMRISLELDMVRSFFTDVKGRSRAIDEVAHDLKYMPILSIETWVEDLPYVLPSLRVDGAQFLALLYKRLLMLEDLRRQWVSADSVNKASAGTAFMAQLLEYQETRHRESQEKQIRSEAFGFKWRNIVVVPPGTWVGPIEVDGLLCLAVVRRIVARGHVNEADSSRLKELGVHHDQVRDLLRRARHVEGNALTDEGRRFWANSDFPTLGQALRKILRTVNVPSEPEKCTTESEKAFQFLEAVGHLHRDEDGQLTWTEPGRSFWVSRQLYRRTSHMGNDLDMEGCYSE